jgi:hypothetical protein
MTVVQIKPVHSTAREYGQSQLIVRVCDTPAADRKLRNGMGMPQQV